MLCYILQKDCINKAAYFAKIYYHTTLQNPTLNGGSATPVSQVHTCIQCRYYWLQEIKMCEGWVAFNDMMPVLFHENLLIGLKVISGRQTHGQMDT
jgi:hypothetical protein